MHALAGDAPQLVIDERHQHSSAVLSPPRKALKGAVTPWGELKAACILSGFRVVSGLAVLFAPSYEQATVVNVNFVVYVPLFPNSNSSLRVTGPTL